MINARILIVQDHASDAAALEACLQELGHTVCATVSSVEQALEKAAETHPDLALIDLGPEDGLDGVEVAQRIGSPLDIPVVYLTGEVDEARWQRAQAARPFGYVLKPFEKPQLHLNIRTALSLHERERAQREARGGLDRTIDELRSRARLLEAVLDSIDDGVIAADENGETLVFNAGAGRMFGSVGPDAAKDQRSGTFGAFLPDRVTPFPHADFPLTRAVAGQSTDDVEMFVRDPDTSAGRLVRVSGRPIHGGEHAGGVIVCRDVTRDREASARLEQAVEEMRLRGETMTTVLDKLGDGIVISDATERSTFLNAAAKRLLGTGVLDAPFSEHSRTYGIFHPDKETHVSTEELPLVRAVNGHDTDDMPLFIRNEDNPDGMVVMARGRSVESTATGKVAAGMAILRPAADHGGTRAGLDDIVGNLRRKNEMLESICDNISDGIIVADATGQVLFVNSTTLKIFGEWFTEPAVADWSATYGIFYPDIKTPVPTEQLPVVRALQGEETGEMELFIRNESNREGTYIISRASPIFNGDRTAVVAAMCTFRDITREKEAEDRLESTGSDLRSQTQLLETVFNSMSEGIVVADATGKFLYVNPSAQEIVGMGPVDEPPEEWAQVYGTYYPDRQTPIKSEDLPLQRAILKGESVDEEDVFIRNQNRPDGIYIRVSARPLLHDVAGVRGGVIIFRDVTEQVNAQEALARAFAQGRLEIVETILHNIGNAINSVTVGIETVRHTLAADPLARRLRALADALKDHQADWIDYISKDPQGRKALPFVIAIADDFAKRNEALARTVERVERRANHIADIVRTQKAIGGPSMSWKDINLKDALTEAARVLQDSLDRRGIRIEIDCEDAPREIRIQESPFHQTIVNLIKNSLEAIDALAASGGLEEAPRIHIRAHVEDDFFLLDVTDNGIGIDMKRHKLIFAAGYTTKESGSGLGLYSSASFVTGSGGQIYPMSDGIGSGTTMRIRLRRSSITPPAAVRSEMEP